jgi:hypothetical protein
MAKYIFRYSSHIQRFIGRSKGVRTRSPRCPDVADCVEKVFSCDASFADSVAARSRIRIMMGHRQVEQAALFMSSRSNGTFQVTISCGHRQGSGRSELCSRHQRPH